MLRLLVAAIAGFVVVLGTGFLSRVVDEPLPFQLGGAVLGFVVVPAIVLRYWRPATSLDSAMRAGAVAVREFDVLNAWQLQETEDEGLHFFLGLADGGTLFLSGQFLYEPFSSGVFPSKRIRVSLDRRSGDVLGIECEGPRVDPIKPLAAFSQQELHRGVYPGHFHEYSETAQVVLGGIGRAA